MTSSQRQPNYATRGSLQTDVEHVSGIARSDYAAIVGGANGGDIGGESEAV